MTRLAHRIARWLTGHNRRKHCPHSNLRGIYGDEINHTPGFRRLICRDCSTLIDGPARLAASRQRAEGRREDRKVTDTRHTPSHTPPRNTHQPQRNT